MEARSSQDLAFDGGRLRRRSIRPRGSDVSRECPAYSVPPTFEKRGIEKSRPLSYQFHFTCSSPPRYRCARWRVRQGSSCLLDRS
jgi:hypothetical protein